MDGRRTPSSDAERTILHVDLDAFYASVEQRDDPGLRGRPVIVGGHAKRGVVCAASYEARPFGVHSAMPMARALALCPDAVVLRPRMDHYASVSRQFFGILEHFTPLVEGLSLDEAFLDVTAVRLLHGDGPSIARAIKQRVNGELSLVASVGVAPCKFVAKIGSDLRKPDGLVVVAAGEVRPFLAPLPVSRLWGVGRVSEKVLLDLGLRTIGDIARVEAKFIESHLGHALGGHVLALAQGFDDRDVDPDREAVSIGHEDTFLNDISDRAELAVHLLDQGDRVAARLRGSGFRARVITLKIKYADHSRVSRRATLPDASCDSDEIGKVAVLLLARVPDIERRRVRLTGVSLSGLEPDADATPGEPASRARAGKPARGESSQLDLFGAAGRSVVGAGTVPEALHSTGRQRGERLGRTLDSIRSRFGGEAIKRAIHIGSGDPKDVDASGEGDG